MVGRDFLGFVWKKTSSSFFRSCLIALFNWAMLSKVLGVLVAVALVAVVLVVLVVLVAVGVAPMVALAVDVELVALVAPVVDVVDAVAVVPSMAVSQGRYLGVKMRGQPVPPKGSGCTGCV